jgi:YHS domain-containing protein
MKRTMLILLATLALGALSTPAAEETKKDAYPLTTCVVSGETLGEMGEPVIFNYEGREVRFCCKMCRKDFLKDPAKYLKMIDDAAAKQTKTEELGG